MFRVLLWTLARHGWRCAFRVAPRIEIHDRQYPMQLPPPRPCAIMQMLTCHNPHGHAHMSSCAGRFTAHAVNSSSKSRSHPGTSLPRTPPRVAAPRPAMREIGTSGEALAPMRSTCRSRGAAPGWALPLPLPGRPLPGRPHAGMALAGMALAGRASPATPATASATASLRPKRRAARATKPMLRWL